MSRSPPQPVAQGAQHVLQGVRGVGVVDDDGQVARAAEVLQAAGSGLEVGQGHEDLVRVRAQAHGGRIDGQEIVRVMRAYEAAPGLLPVDAEEHAFEALL